MSVRLPAITKDYNIVKESNTLYFRLYSITNYVSLFANFV